MEVRAVVEQIVKDYGTRSPYELADLMGINVIRQNLGIINGYFMELCGIKQIALNNNLDEAKESYVLAHEIGHNVLHAGLNEMFVRYNTNLSTGKIERQADKFAMELLISDEMITEAKNCNYTIEQASKILGLPEELIRLRLQ